MFDQKENPMPRKGKSHSKSLVRYTKAQRSTSSLLRAAKQLSLGRTPMLGRHRTRSAALRSVGRPVRTRSAALRMGRRPGRSSALRGSRSARSNAIRREYLAAKRAYHLVGKKAFGKPERSEVKKDYIKIKREYKRLGRQLGTLTGLKSLKRGRR